MVVIALVGCEGGDEATSVERPETTTVVVTTTAPPEQTELTPEEKLLRWIRSCDVRRIIFAHGATHITFGHGGTVRLRIKASAEEKVLAAAFRQRCSWDSSDGRILVGIE
jgi:hypothetical protein